MPEWPGEPHRLWNEVLETPHVSRPPLPPWETYDEFLEHAHVSRLWTAGAGILFVAVIPGVVAWSLRNELWLIAVICAAIAAVMVVGALSMMVWDLIGRGFRLRRMHRRALADGIAANAYPAPLWMPSHSEGRATDPAYLLISTRLSDYTADRIHAVFGAWARVLLDDKDQKHAAWEIMGRRKIIPLEEIFGPGATGAWLAQPTIDELDHESSPWRIIMPHKQLELSTILPVAAPEGTGSTTR
ncbi:hypothetical protein FB566_2150 [Stackebrandtia endophytica]|uniref:Uncharacterized protein n=1 Tax=Stackebrandtia endophytica TaxID=1496996 RepID=A0A543AVL8_9ACTN|nr:hypothetical protein [Stackebrandtia endophytica]TQL76617.1 hypothetical protein FB566_2150 [Stackebrandtia endophytica]